MNTYPHHIGDFNTATRHLSRDERAMYRDMLDMYYDKECPLDGSDFDLLAKRLLCVTPEDVASLQFLLQEFFEELEDGQWRHDRCERELAIYRSKQDAAGAVKKNENTRQTRSRAWRSAIFSALRQAGHQVHWRTSIEDARRLCEQHGVPVPACPEPVAPVTVTRVTRHGLDTGNQNQNQNHINTPPTPPPGGAAASAQQSQPEAQPPSPPPPEAQARQTGAGQGSSTAMVTAVALSGYFPEHRRTRLAETAEAIAALLDAGIVTTESLLRAASQQASHLSRDEGKACPGMLRWLREGRWLDTPPPAPKPPPMPTHTPLTPEQVARNRAHAAEAVARIRGTAPQRQAA